MLHENATARHLGLLRMWVFGMWLGDLLKDGESKANVMLAPGDVIIIPESMF